MTHGTAGVRGAYAIFRPDRSPQTRGARLVRLAMALGLATLALLGPARGESAALQGVACISTDPLPIGGDPRECPAGRSLGSVGGFWSVTPLPTGRAVTAVQLTKKLDVTSPTLLFDAISQRTFPSVLIGFFDDRGGRVFSILLTTVSITSLVTAAADQPDGIPVETLSLTFTRIETAFLSARMCWDIAQNRAC